ncbi:MAG: hypothetical protein GW893_23000 [Armatimonadetes bacterium]|nr:hypothetical protein [Armatimonadota bacterium]
MDTSSQPTDGCVAGQPNSAHIPSNVEKVPMNAQRERLTIQLRGLRVGFLCAAWLLTGLCPLAAQVGSNSDDLNISGTHTITFQTNSVSGGAGAESSYELDNYGANKAIENQTSLTASGNLFGNFYIDALYNKSTYGYSDSRVLLMYDAGDTDISIGDLNINFAGSELTSFSRTLQGLKIDSLVGDRHQLNFVVSQTDAATATDVFQGNNTVGPYYLTHSPILDGTEEVRVDEKVKIRGQDYVIDYTFGSLTFTGVNIIPSTSTIAVSYEYNQAGQSSGIFYGLRGTFPLTKSLSLGTTYLKQDAAKAGGSSGPIREREDFSGQNSPGPYALTFRPIVEGSEQITINAVLQVPDRDYEINYVSGTITFVRPVAYSSLIVVEYNYDPGSGAVTGGQALWGVDGKWTFADGWDLGFEFAGSQGGATATDKGTGYSLRTAGVFGNKLNVTLGLREIGEGFQRIESAGFNRDESGFDMGLQYALNPHLSLDAKYNNYTTSQGLYFGSTGGDTTGGTSDTTQLNAVVAFKKEKLPQLTFTHQEMTSSNVNPAGGTEGEPATTTNSSDFISNNVDMSFTQGNINLTGNVNQTEQTGISTGVDTTAANTGSLTRSGKLGITYIPARSIRLAIDVAASAIQEDGKWVSTADSSNLGLTYTPTPKLSVSLSQYKTQSDGQGSSTAYSGSFIGSAGFGFPSYGSGFGSGYGSGYGIGTTTGATFGSVNTGTTGFVNTGVGGTGYQYGAGGYNLGTGSFGSSGGFGGTVPSTGGRVPGTSSPFSTTQGGPGLTTTATASGLVTMAPLPGITGSAQPGLTNATSGAAPGLASSSWGSFPETAGKGKKSPTTQDAPEGVLELSRPSGTGLTVNASPGFTTHSPDPGITGGSANTPDIGQGHRGDMGIPPVPQFRMAEPGWGSPLTPFWGRANADGWGPWWGHRVTSLGPATEFPLIPRNPALHDRQSDGSISDASSLESKTTSIRADYAFSERLSLNASINQQLNLGTGTVIESDSNDYGIGGSLRLTDDLSLLAQYTEQKLIFLDSSDNSHSKITTLGVQWGRPDKLNVSLDFQRLLSFTNEGATYVGGDGGFLESQLDTYGVRVNYPISSRYNLFTQYFDSKTIGSDAEANNTRKELSVGVDYRISNFLTFSAWWSNQESLYEANPDQNYTAKSLEAKLEATFATF